MWVTDLDRIMSIVLFFTYFMVIATDHGSVSLSFPSDILTWRHMQYIMVYMKVVEDRWMEMLPIFTFYWNNSKCSWFGWNLILSSPKQSIFSRCVTETQGLTLNKQQWQGISPLKKCWARQAHMEEPPADGQWGREGEEGVMTDRQDQRHSLFMLNNIV